MSISTVMVAKSSISDGITEEKSIQSELRTIAVSSKARLNELASRYSVDITEIQGYIPTGVFEELSQDELGKMVTEYTALIGILDVIIGAIDG